MLDPNPVPAAKRNLRGVEGRAVPCPVLDHELVVDPDFHAVIARDLKHVFSRGNLERPFSERRKEVRREPWADRAAPCIVQFLDALLPDRLALLEQLPEGLVLSPRFLRALVVSEPLHGPIDRQVKPPIAESHWLTRGGDPAAEVCSRFAHVLEFKLAIDRLPGLVLDPEERGGWEVGRRMADLLPVLAVGRGGDDLHVHGPQEPRHARRAQHLEDLLSVFDLRSGPELGRLEVVGPPLIHENVAPAPELARLQERANAALEGARGERRDRALERLDTFEIARHGVPRDLEPRKVVLGFEIEPLDYVSAPQHEGGRRLVGGVGLDRVINAFGDRNSLRGEHEIPPELESRRLAVHLHDLFHAAKEVAKDARALGVSQPHRSSGEVMELVLVKVRVAARSVSVLRVAPVGVLAGVLPKNDPVQIAPEDVSIELIVLPVLEGDAFGVQPESIGDHLRVVAVAAPNPVPALEDQVVDERVAAEGGLDPVRRRVAEVVAEKQVVVAAPLPGVHRGLARPQKEPIAAVRHGVVGEHVLVRLLVDEDACGVLTPVVDAVTVAPNAPVDPVVEDAVRARSVHRKPHAGEKREVGVPHEPLIAPGEHESVERADHSKVPHLEPVAIFEIGPTPLGDPLTLFVVVIAHPVRAVLAVQRRKQARFVAVGKVAVQYLETPDASGEKPDPVASGLEVLDRNVRALDDQGGPLSPVGIDVFTGSPQSRAAKVHDDSVALNADRRGLGVVCRVCEFVHLGDDSGRAPNHHSGLKFDRLFRTGRKTHAKGGEVDHGAPPAFTRLFVLFAPPPTLRPAGSDPSGGTVQTATHSG
ncbi:MAG: hypothetical protein CNCCGFBP_01997 [Fimbriimonadaceae bacterium]|nr:hypothetical protein [Fimbriimonadaceae bacterium]